MRRLRRPGWEGGEERGIIGCCYLVCEGGRARISFAVYTCYSVVSFGD